MADDVVTTNTGEKSPSAPTVRLTDSFGVNDVLGNMPDQDVSEFEVEDDNAAQVDQVLEAQADDEEAEGNEPTVVDGTGKAAAVEEDGDKAKTEEKKPAAKAAPADDDTELDDNGNPLPKGFKRRLERATRQRDAVQRELDDLKAKQAEPAKVEDKAKDAPTEAPNAADFDDYEDYLEAKTLFEKSKGKPKEKAKTEEKPAPKADDAKPDAEVVAALESIGGLVTEVLPDVWKQVTDPANPLNLAITRDMLLAIDEAENPDAILKAFVDKPALSEEIAKLSPRAQILRIAKLDVPLTDAQKKAAPAAKAKDGAPAAPKKVSQAPEPIDPLKGKAAPTKAVEDMSFAEYEAHRASEDKAKPGDWW